MTRKDPAEGRLWLLTVVRLLGIGVAVGGLAIAGGSDGAAVRLAAGLAVMASGAAITLLGPRLLARRWKP